MKVEYKSDCRGMTEDEIIKTILQDRGIEDVGHFLCPTEDDLLPLDALKNIKEAAEIVNHAIDYSYKIAILADTDLDGLTSGAIIYRYLKDFGADITVFIDAGKQHGVQKEDVNKYKPFQLFIIVDSLNDNAFLYEEILKESNVEDIIILDHHVVNSKIPYEKYVTLVSSQVEYDNKQLSGSGVTWKFVKYLDSINGTDFADKYIDLAASGIISDMCSVIEPENRYIISKGLEEIKNPAIKKIIGSFDWNSTAVAFSLAPLANASNRMNRNEDAINAFLVDDNSKVLKYVKAMKNCKDEQNAEIDKIMDNVIKQGDSQLDKKMIIIDIDTSSSIAGLIGNKILERYQRPILIVTDKDDCYQGSMRAVGVDDFCGMLNESKLARSFGHENAAGVIFKKEDRQKLIDYMDEHLPEVGQNIAPISVDIRLNLNDITRGLINRIKELDKISGTGFKQIRIYVNGITDYEIGQMSDYKHLVIKPEDSKVTIIKWNWNGNWDDVEDHAMMGDELEFVATLDSGFIGRTYMLKCICDNIEFEE